MGSMQYIKPPAQVHAVIAFDGFYQLHQGHRTSADPRWPQFKRFLSPQQLPLAPLTVRQGLKLLQQLHGRLNVPKARIPTLSVVFVNY